MMAPRLRSIIEVATACEQSITLVKLRFMISSNVPGLVRELPAALQVSRRC
jgi:hypothetical protein